MPRKRKTKQSFAFPAADQPSDAELDAMIDGEPGNAATKTAEARSRKNAEDKKKVAAAVKEIPVIFTPEQVAWIVDAYIGILCFAFSILLKCDFQPLYDALAVPPEMKEAWSRPLAKIASKYAPAEWAGMTAEIELVASVGLYSVMAFGRARKVAEEEKKRKQEEEAARRGLRATPQRPVAQQQEPSIAL